MRSRRHPQQRNAYPLASLEGMPSVVQFNKLCVEETAAGLIVSVEQTRFELEFGSQSELCDAGTATPRGGLRAIIIQEGAVALCCVVACAV